MRPFLSLLVASVTAASALVGCAPRIVIEEHVERVVAAPGAAFDSAAVVAEVTATLRAQEAAWNEGNLRGFMDTYLRTREMTFLSGGVVRQGWQDAYYAYVRSYPDAEAMGTLAFTDLMVRPLSPTSALAWGRWRLAQGDATPGGLFTLLLEKRRGTWRILHDHTSSE